MYNRKTLVCDNDGLMNELVDNFLSDKPKRLVYGNFRIETNRLVYIGESKERINVNKDNQEEFFKLLDSGKIRFKSTLETKDSVQAKINSTDKYAYIECYKKEINVIAKRIKRVNQSDIIIGNSTMLPLVGRIVAYGNVRNNRSETLIQRKLAVKVPMIPFSAFEQDNLDINKIEILEQSGSEVVKRAYKEWKGDKEVEVMREVHFTGASLFKVEDTHFLFDIDRNEIVHGIFNPFIVTLKYSTKTIKEAYEQLQPASVVKAVKAGKKVLRQGEWFFIPVSNVKLPKLTKTKILEVMATNTFSNDMIESLIGKKKLERLKKSLVKSTSMVPRQLSLQVGKNRPNNAQLGFQRKGKTFVKGKISHSGREHKDIVLKQWYEAVPNTSAKSVQITGDID